MATDRVPLDDSDFDLIQPRPEPEPEPQPLPTAEPEPLQKAVAIANPAKVVIPQPMAREVAPRGMVEHDGPTRDQILLTAIVRVARKEQTPVTVAAMRTLIAKFSCECGLDF
jgi:hypothetical protein